MSPTFNVICSFALTYGFPMAFAARELWVLNRNEGRGDGGDRAPVAPKPLPDCLIPKLAPKALQDRQREDALELV
jgi:hypothetical protein